MLQEAAIAKWQHRKLIVHWSLRPLMRHFASVVSLELYVEHVVKVTHNVVKQRSQLMQEMFGQASDPLQKLSKLKSSGQAVHT